MFIPKLFCGVVVVDVVLLAVVALFSWTVLLDVSIISSCTSGGLDGSFDFLISAVAVEDGDWMAGLPLPDDFDFILDDLVRMFRLGG